ncbi:hypothetical protein MRX56_17030, partial [Pseudodesulfovibrio sp. S3-i]|uniref:hypothetical protein n=1 Tax=Pseudodesulfovibrio sp. S3-i TaxID=2929474 RepID=UPI001FBB1B98
LNSLFNCQRPVRLFLKERPAVRQEWEAMLSARSRQHFFSTFFQSLSGVGPAVRQEGEAMLSARSRQHLFQLFFSRLSVSAPPSGRKGKLCFRLAPVNTFFNFFSVNLFGANRSICLRKNKPLRKL